MNIFTRKLRTLLLAAALAVGAVGLSGCGDNGVNSGGGTAPAITTASLPNGTVGTAYSKRLAATGDAPITWSLESGALPMGLSLLGSGTISGTPATAGTSNFTVKATNSAGSDIKSLSIVIGAAGGGGGVAKTIVITGLPAAYQYVAIALYPVGTTVDDVANETVDIVAASGVGMPGASGSTYPLYGMDDNRWTGSGSYAVYLVLQTGSNSSESKLYRASSVSFTAATTTVAFSQFTEITSGGTTPTYSLDGVWEMGGFRVTVSGSTGFINTVGTNALWQDAANKGYVSIGGQLWRNLTSTGTLTWSGQGFEIGHNTNTPNVANGTTRWTNSTFTMSADGQTLTVSSEGGTWTRSSHTLDGVWEMGGFRVTVSGSTGVINTVGTNALWQDAVNKGYVSIGEQLWRNLTSTGTLTWSGQAFEIGNNTNTPNVANGNTRWANSTFTMSADGQTLTVSGEGGTWTRKQ